MNDNEIAIIEQLYNRLLDCYLLIKNKSSIKSLFIELLKVKNNIRFTVLRKSALEEARFSKFGIENLSNKNLIRSIEGTNKITLTAKGIFYFEENNKNFTHDNIIEFVDSKYFGIVNETEKKLSNRDKVILLSMILGRTYSRNSCIDLRRSEKAKEVWTEITNLSIDILVKFNAIKISSPEDIFGKSKSDPPIINLYRHSDQLPRKTNRIFKSRQRQLKYYLDLYNREELNVEKLGKLLEKIFYKVQLNSGKIEILLEKYKEIAQKDIYLFDPEEHIFSNIKFNRIFKDVLLTI